MKKLILTISFILFGSSAFATNYCSSDAKGCWTFTEGSGTTVADSSGNANTGTFLSSGHPAWENTDLPSRSYITYAAFYDGTTDNINCGTTANLFPTNGTAWSMVAWVNTGSGSLTVSYRIVDKSASTTGPAINYTTQSNFQLQAGGGTALSATSAVNSSLANGSWHHVAVTWDGTNTASTGIKIYIDGSVSSHATDQNGVSLTDNSASSFLIGSRAADNARVWPKYITEVAVWNRVLSSSEVTDIYTNGLGAGAAPAASTVKVIANTTVNGNLNLN